MQQDHKVANLEFSIGKYIRNDKYALIVDALASFALVYLADEWLDFDDRITGKLKSIFVFVGFTGSYVILQMMSVAKANFRKAVDHKTSQSDKLDDTLDKPTPTEPPKETKK